MLRALLSLALATWLGTGARQPEVLLERRFFILEIPLHVSRWATPCDADTGYQYSMETQFREFLVWQPSWRTNDWRAADFIWLAQCATKVYFHLRQNYSFSHQAALALADAEYLRPAARWANAHPAWKRFFGANFVTVYAMDLGRQDFPVALEETRNWSVGTLPGEEDWLQKANIWALPDVSAPDRCAEETSSTAEGRVFYPQDFVISIPSRFVYARGILPQARASARTRLAFFAGSLNSCARRWLHSLYGSLDPAEVWVQGSALPSEQQYQEAMLSSKFCLVLRGSSHTNNVRLVDVMAHGCVPVIVSDDFHPPLEWRIPWQDVALFFRTADLPRLIDVLREADDTALRRELLGGEDPPAQALDFARQEYWVDIFQELAGKLDQSQQPSSPRAKALRELFETARDVYVSFLDRSGCPAEISQMEDFVSEEVFGCNGAEGLWPALESIRSRARRGGGGAQLILELAREAEEQCPEPFGEGKPADWMRLEGSLAPEWPGVEDLLQICSTHPGCFLLLLRGTAAAPRGLLGGEPLFAERRVRFLVLEFLRSQWHGITVWHAGHFMFSLGYACFLVGVSDLFLFSGKLWDDAYAMPSRVHLLCGHLEDDELGLLLQVYGLEDSRGAQVLRAFRSLYDYG